MKCFYHFLWQQVKLNARKNDTNPSTIAVDIVTRAASLVAPVPPPVDKHLDFFIVNEVRI
jgi:hypothetical protein